MFKNITFALVEKRKLRMTSFRVVKAAMEGMDEKKGEDICCLNLKKIPASICDYFVICHGNSRPQIEAISNSVLGTVRKKTGRKPWHMEGLKNAQWILLDYADVVVHIMNEEARNFYRLEDLWADAGKIIL